MPESDDRVLLDAWRAGDESSGNQLFRRHFAAVHRFFRNKAGVDAEDLAQRTFLACVEGRPRIRDEASFRTYLFAVARNQLLMYFRRRGRRGVAVSLEHECVADLGEFPQRFAVRREEQQFVLLALRRIPLGYQEVLELHYWENMPVSETAEVLDLSSAAVKSRLTRGRRLLRRQLSRIVPSESLLASTLGELDKWVRSLPGQGVLESSQ